LDLSFQGVSHRSDRTMRNRMVPKWIEKKMKTPRTEFESVSRA
jgi:hypothetical protein